MVVMAIGLTFIVSSMINFEHTNSSSVILEAMPWKYHARFYVVGFLLIFISLISFFASYFEQKLLLTISNLACSFAIAALVILSIGNEVSSKMISSDMDNRCAFMMPVFSQETLMTHGCPIKYASFHSEADKLTCKPKEIARIWEDNMNMLV